VNHFVVTWFALQCNVVSRHTLGEVGRSTPILPRVYEDAGVEHRVDVGAEGVLFFKVGFVDRPRHVHTAYINHKKSRSVNLLSIALTQHSDALSS